MQVNHKKIRLQGRLKVLVFGEFSSTQYLINQIAREIPMVQISVAESDQQFCWFIEEQYFDRVVIYGKKNDPEFLRKALQAGNKVFAESRGDLPIDIQSFCEGDPFLTISTLNEAV